MILVDGEFHEGTVASFDFADRGFTLGDGLFETMPVFGGRVWRLADHLDRLERGLAVLGFSVPRARLEADVAAMAERAPNAGGVLRLTVTRGSGARGLAPPAMPTPRVVVSLAPFNPALVFEPTSLATVGLRRNDRSPVARLKALPYLDNVLALREAQEAGARDALILNTHGRIACSSVANVFRLVGNELETPPVDDGVLPGIARSRLLERAADLGLDAVERSLTVQHLIEADAVFLTNSVRLVQPVERLGDAPLPVPARLRRLLDTLLDDIRADCGTAPTV